MRKLFSLVLMIFFGGLGGLLLPGFIAKRWPNAPFIPQEQTVVVNKTEQVVLGGRETIQKAYQGSVPTLVAIQSFRGTAVQLSGVGFLVSADGFVLTRREAVSPGATQLMVERAGASLPARIAKTSEKYGLVLLKVDASNLPVVSFSRDVGSSVGTTVFLFGMRRGESGQIPFANQGIIRSVDGAFLDTTITEDFGLATGAPLVALDGSVIGIASVNSSGYVFAVSADAIREFLNF